jgi:hypothetical protein
MMPATKLEGVVRLSRELDLPASAVTQKFAMMGRTGSGKTYAAGVLVEGLLDIGAQVIILDPVGVWWGIRLNADGRTPAYPVAVFGGLHGDLPLHDDNGGALAELLCNTRAPAVVDVSMLRKGQRKRFLADFLERLFELQKTKRSPVHIVFEEAHTVAPQKAFGPDDARLSGAAEDVIKLGRNFGIGVSLLDQRPQSVDKDVLNQTECLIALQLNGAHERKAIKDWISEKDQDADLVEELPKLEVGQAWIWSPQWLKIAKKVHIGKKKSFNASATPELGDDLAAPSLPSLDLEKIRATWEAQVRDQQESSPAAQRKRIRELERQLEAARAEKASPPPVERVPQALVKELREVRTTLGEISARIAEAIGGAFEPKTFEDLENAGWLKAKTPPEAFVAYAGTPSPAKIEPVGELGSGEVRILAVVHQLGMAGKAPKASRAWVGVLAGYSASGGTFQRYISTLRSGGYVGEQGGAFFLTDKGARIAKAQRAITADEVIAGHLAGLGGGESKILRALITVYPDSMEKNALGAHAGYTASGGTFSRYISTLVGRDLVERVDHGAEYRATDALFAFGPWSDR